MSKVYCKNCKHLKWGSWCEHYDHVRAWTGTVKELFEEKMGRSRYCSHYQQKQKRKWWKFWV